MRPIFKSHESHGHWFTLIPQMRAENSDRFSNYFRNTVEEFDELLKLVGPHIKKQTTFFRKSVCAMEKDLPSVFGESSVKLQAIVVVLKKLPSVKL